MSNLEAALKHMDVRKLSRALCGDKSELCQRLRDEGNRLKLDEVERALTDFRRFGKQREFFPTSGDLLEGFLQTIAAAGAAASSEPTAASPEAVKAIAAFDRAWGLGPVGTPERLQGDEECYGFSGPKTLGFWVVKDMLDRWRRTNLQGTSDPAKTPYEANTPVLAADLHGRVGYLLNLHVELFPRDRGGPLCPDPFYVGFTDINTAGDSFVQALQNVWDASWVSRRFRARWRLENPGVGLRPESQIQYPMQIAGPSAQAALLCAILAASGDPYWSGDIEDSNSAASGELGEGQTQFVDMAEPLDPLIAISAEVVIDEGRHAVDFRVKSVGGVDAKLDVARRSAASPTETEQRAQANSRLDTVLLADTTNVAAVPHLKVLPVDSIREALDIMLLTNQYMRSYKDAVERAWLVLWDPEESGRYPQPAKDK